MYSQKRSRATFENEAPPHHAPYALYGTPLPAFDADVRDDGSYVPIWKQEVTDEHGRKRLHGAFTGGLSAGYFNTVGSKEGWTPSTFVSSRTNRAKTDQQRKVEDFMDDEDLAEQAESQKLETQDTFAGLGSGNTNGSARGLFSDLFKTTGETMGVKLLQRMGWRQGQGIGPKVKRRAQDDRAGDDHLFAPEDSRMISFSRKNDRKGLGFAGESSITQSKADSHDDEDEEADARIFSSRRSKVIGKVNKVKQSSFGVGILNDTGSDDEDAYAIGPAIKYNRIIGGDKAKKKGGLIMSSVVRPGNASQKLAQRSVSTTAGFRKCHDGRLPLAGFILSIKPALLSEEHQYPPPTVPIGWQPSKLTGTTSSMSYQSTADAAKASTLDAKARAALLGEQQLPGKSIFDFLKPAARDKLAAASGRENLPQARSEAAPGQANNTSVWDAIPRLEKETAIAALQRGSKGWMPYSEDVDNRSRYKAYITTQAGLTTSIPEHPEGLSHDDWIKELHEFAQAAEVFKPISGLMASRFTTSSASPQMASDRPDAAQLHEKTKDPAKEAAAAGMYGPLTRSRLPFHPTRLLCKRFNVKPPANVEVDPDDEQERRTDLVSKATIDRMMVHATFRTPTFANGGTEGGEQSMPREPARVDAGVNTALEQGRADESVLKSVFEDDPQDESKLG